MEVCGWSIGVRRYSSRSLPKCLPRSRTRRLQRSNRTYGVPRLIIPGGSPSRRCSRRNRTTPCRRPYPTDRAWSVPWGHRGTFLKSFDIAFSLEMKKGPESKGFRALKNDPGDVLFSHTVTRAVPSALKGLTAEFGMGSGVSPLPWSPGTFTYQRV